MTRDTPTGPTRPFSSLELPESSALCLAYTDKYIFVGLPSGRICAYSAETFKLEADLNGHTRGVLTLLHVRNDKNSWLFSGSADSTVRVWDARYLKPLWVIHPPHDGFGDVLSLAYLHGRITFGTQSCALLWVDLPGRKDSLDGLKTPPSRQDESQLRYHKFFDSQPALDLSRAHAAAHGRLYSSLNDLTLVSSRESTSSNSLYELGRGSDDVECLSVDPADLYLSAHFGYIYALTVVKIDQDSYLATGAGDGSVKLWRYTAEGFQFWCTLVDEQDEGVLALANRGSTTLYAGFQGGSVGIYDLATLTLIRTLSTGNDDVLAINVTANACYISTADGRVQAYSHSFMLKNDIAAHTGLALSCAASSDGEVLFTGGNDSSLRVWHFPTSSDKASVRSEAIQGRLFDLLATFVSFRSISALEDHREECRQTALWLKDTLTSLGAFTTLLPGASGRNPIILSTFSPQSSSTVTTKRKRILFYGHYDVVDAKGTWSTPDPFTLAGLGTHLQGRGVIDNKGPILATAVAAADLLERGELDLDVVLLLEGEEEVDSAGLQDAVRKHSAQIGKIDAVLVSNSYSLSEDMPSLMFGLRGRINFTLSVQSQNPDLHSGMMGGISSEPLVDLTRLLSTMTEAKTSRVLIPGFYDHVRPATESEDQVYNELIARSPDAVLRKLVQHSRYQDVRSALTKLWREPSLSIHGIEVSGSLTSSVIPGQAKARVSVRTVPDMSLKTISASMVKYLKDTFAEVRSEGNTLQVSIDSMAPWWIADRDHPYSLAAEEAIFDEWGIRPVWIREGGSLPSLPFLESHFSACVVHLPMGSQGDHAHLINERTAIVNLQKGKNAVERWLQLLPGVSVAEARPSGAA